MSVPEVIARWTLFLAALWAGYSILEYAVALVGMFFERWRRRRIRKSRVEPSSLPRIQSRERRARPMASGMDSLK